MSVIERLAECNSVGSFCESDGALMIPQTDSDEGGSFYFWCVNEVLCPAGSLDRNWL